jgi:hypothetical protein
LEEICLARKILDAQPHDRGMVRRLSPSVETLCVQIALVVDAWQLVPHDPEQMVLGTMMFRCCPAITTAMYNVLQSKSLRYNDTLLYLATLAVTNAATGQDA